MNIKEQDGSGPSNLDRLRTYLRSLGPGPVPTASHGAVIDLTSSCWHELKGDHGGMVGSKLYNRTENLSWDPPHLSFAIERHGSTAMGSVSADVQFWSVDIESGTAFLEHVRRRLVRPRNRPLDVQPLAEEIAEFINHGKDDSRLRWYSTEDVEVRTGRIIPANCPQRTLIGRRRRFRTALSAILQERGWRQLSTGRARFRKNQQQ